MGWVRVVLSMVTIMTICGNDFHKGYSDVQGVMVGVFSPKCSIRPLNFIWPIFWFINIIRTINQ
jgi:hypothetical protein